jgi:isopentenyl-diphosphate Delta-isomerase
MSSNEMIDVLNEAGEVVGTISREQAERDNHITENVLVFVFNSRGRVWIQLRPQTKKHYPGRWDISACGGIVSGETHQQAAIRETFEEMGIKTELHHTESFINVFPGDNGEERKRLSHLYVGVSDEQPKASDEVDEFRLCGLAELRADAGAHPNVYVPSFILELEKAIRGYKVFCLGKR